MTFNKSLGRGAAIVILVVLAIWLRLEYVSKTEINNPIRADARQYILYGYNLATHGVLSQDPVDTGPPKPDAFRSPGYPLLIAATFLSSGRDYYGILLRMQAVLGALTVLVSYLLARRLLERWAAFLVALFVAFSPHLVSMTAYALTETLFGFLLTTAVWVLLEAQRRDRVLWLWSIAGVLLGLSYLTNETAGFIPFALLACAALCQEKATTWRDRPVRLLPWAVCLGVFVLAPISWGMRNHLKVPERTSRGSQRALNALTHGAYPGFVFRTEEFKYYPYREDPEQPRFSSTLSDFWEIFSRRVAERPLRYLSWYLLEKPYLLWTWDILQGEGDIYVYPRDRTGSLYDQSAVANITKHLMRLLHPVLQVLTLLAPFLVAVEVLRGRSLSLESERLLTPLIIIVGYTALYAIFCPWPRYSIPLRPLFYVVSAWSLQKSSTSLRSVIRESPGD